MKVIFKKIVGVIMWLRPNIFFIHIPKNAGSSFELAFGLHHKQKLSWLDPEGKSTRRLYREVVSRSRFISHHAARVVKPKYGSTVNGNLFGNLTVPLVSQHLTLLELLGLGLIGTARAREVTFVYVKRNPYSRLISLWGEAVRNSQTTLSLDPFLRQQMNLKQSDQVFASIEEAALSRHANLSRMRLQTEFVSLKGSCFESLDLKMECLRFENISEDFSDFLSRHGVGNMNFPWLNKGINLREKEWKSLVSAKTTDLVNRYFYQDFKEFDYDLE